MKKLENRNLVDGEGGRQYGQAFKKGEGRRLG